MNYLKFTFKPDDDGTGELFAEFSANGFSGHGSAWFDKQNLCDISKEFEQYPLPTDKKPTIEGGYWGNEKPAQLSQEHLHISAYPIDSRGNLGLRIRATTDLCTDERKESQHFVAVELKTNYSAMERFAKDLQKLVTGTIKELVISENTV